MLTKATTYWYPAENRALVVPRTEGPFVLDGSDPDAMAMALMHAPPVFFFTSDVAYTQKLEAALGTSPHTGVRHSAFQCMQLNESYFGADPSGEPDPFDPDDLTAYPYIVFGHRLWLRGMIGSQFSDDWNTSLEIQWADEVVRAMGDTSRGCWTGTYLGPFSAFIQGMTHLFQMAHGKRSADANWVYLGGDIQHLALGPITTTTSAPVVDNGIQQGRIRATVSGSSPSWTVDLQYYNGAAWVTVHSVALDIESDMFDPTFNGMAAGAIVGQTQLHPGVPPVAPTFPQEHTWIHGIEAPEFQPFVLDITRWTGRELFEKLEPWIGPLPVTPYPWPLQAADLLHIPVGSGYDPIELRSYEEDLGWCVHLHSYSPLRSYAKADSWGILQPSAAAGGIPFLFCDDTWGAGDPGIPFFVGQRAKYTDMDTWASDRHLFSFGHIMGVPAPGDNGVGVLWRNTGGAGEGELVARCYDIVAHVWVEITTPFDAADWNGVAVDICIAWTGECGDDAQRDDWEFRMLVDNEVVDAALVPDFGSGPLDRATVGPDRRGLTWYEGWGGFLSAFVIYNDALSDDEARVAFTRPGVPFVNPSFELPAEDGCPGGAAAWLWDCYQQVGRWAEFNTYREDLAPWQTAVEEMAAGWGAPYRWRYADAIARLAATGFTAEDVGLLAYEEDTDTEWVLTGYSPITWAQSVTDTNEVWAADLAAVAVISAVFNEGVTAHEDTAEQFQLWTFPGGYTGPPWLDTWGFIAPWEDTIGPGPTGWTGWYDAIFGGHTEPIRSEAFAEAWGNDPFSTAPGESWHPLSAPNGVLRGSALTFPVTIAPDRARMVVFRDTPYGYDLTVTAGTYATAPALAAELETRWQAAAGAASGFEFRSWSDGDDAGVEFGWDGSTATSGMFMLGVLESAKYNDAREALGFDRFGPRGRRTDLSYPVTLLPSAPAGATADDRLLLDSWTMLEVAILTEPRYATDTPVEYGLQHAIFDAIVPDPSWLEEFTLDGWVAIGATWKVHYDPGDLVAAVFTGATTMEQFLASEWPDELWT